MKKKNTYDIDYLKELRGDIKKADFARQLGISKQYYHNLESGLYHSEIPLYIVKKMKFILDLTPEQVCKLMGIK